MASNPFLFMSTGISHRIPYSNDPSQTALSTGVAGTGLQRQLALPPAATRNAARSSSAWDPLDQGRMRRHGRDAPRAGAGSRAGPLGRSCSASGSGDRFVHRSPLLQSWRSAHVCGEEVLLEGREMRAQEWLNHSLSLVALLFILELALQQ